MVCTCGVGSVGIERRCTNASSMKLVVAPLSTSTVAEWESSDAASLINGEWRLRLIGRGDGGQLMMLVQTGNILTRIGCGVGRTGVDRPSRSEFPIAIYCSDSFPETGKAGQFTERWPVRR